jgi:hypothetical protein
MRRLLFTTAALLLGCNASLAQVSTMGSTAMGLASTPGTIVTSPLNGPSPFSATTQPGTPDTTLAPVPLASDPTTPGTVDLFHANRANHAWDSGSVSYFHVGDRRHNRHANVRGTDGISNTGYLFHARNC